MTPECLKAIHEDQEEAERLYVSLNRKALTFLENNGCTHADVCAAEVMDRFCAIAVVKKIRNPRSFVRKIAYNILYECKRKMNAERRAGITYEEIRSSQRQNESDEGKERCRRYCMGQLAPADRALVTGYFVTTGKEKLKTARKKLAKELALSEVQLRKKVFKIRRDLEICVAQCLAKPYKRQTESH